ncbi:outer membrane protein [Yoonia sp. 2307UL14-13]|uniref:outer membrane protein n=1 Tax=Yoonia sp. 2307UL14-13 TaxID=3126506 RepID=UPI0030A9D21C
MTTLKSVALATTFLLPTAALADWTGGYSGLSFGPNLTNEFTLDNGTDSETFEAEDSNTIGFFGGFLAQSNQIVYGGEIAFSTATDVEFVIDGDSVSGDIDLFDLKGRVGFDAGEFLPYAVAGISRVDDDATGFNFGVGVDYAINPSFLVGAEYLARRTTFDDDIDGIETDFDIDTFSIRGSFKF